MPSIGMSTSQNTPDQTPGSPADGSWVTEAIAEQEEYIKRIHSCMEVVGTPHTYERFTARPGVYYSACTRCRVTETSEDYATKLGS